jgi:hypothetical protein
MIDLFYHSRHVSWMVNLTEDTVLVKSSWMSAKLVLEHSQRFTVNVDSEIRVGEDMGTGPERTAGIQGKEIGESDILDAIVSGCHSDLHGVRNDIPLKIGDHRYIRCI